MIRQTLEGGSRLARASIAGNAVGTVLWSTAVEAGLSAVLLADPAAYMVVRVAGGLVLIVLGIGTLRSTHGANDAARGGGGGRRLTDGAAGQEV
ncbi:LysE family transporter, partial [Streptomyces hokutonensis]|uniref:LysE family transporter n=1 Tax=Streptomyces hokutonensis TaxID=1306990 RepID=UPI0003785338